MFSVVIPLYNKEDSIFNTINSVLTQTFTYFELLIINDGSTDNSLCVVQRFKDPRVRIINKSNSGVSDTRNRGIREAKYEWIAFLDADDSWHASKLMVTKDIIEKFHGLKWILSGYYIIKNGERRKVVYSTDGVLADIVDDLNQGLKIQTSSVVVNKSIYFDENFFFTEGINNSEDREVWYKLACSFQSPYYISKALASYIIDPSGNSLTGRVIHGKKENFHFLTLESRLEPFISNIQKSRAENMSRYIQTANRDSIIGFWIRNKRVFPDQFKDHLTLSHYYLFKLTSHLPSILKRILIKVIKSVDR